MKILISAFSCAPGLGSEPGLGWSVTKHASSENLVWVLTDEHNREHIDVELYKRTMPNAHFVFVQIPSVLGISFSTRWYGYCYYSLWQVVAFFVALRLHRRLRFDLVHHVSYGNSWMPSWMGFLGIPFIWNGGLKKKIPWKFLRTLSWKSHIAETARNIAIAAGGMATLFTTAKRASVILSPSDPDLWGGLLTVRQSAFGGLEREDVNCLGRLPLRREGPFRVASIGRLEGLKGLTLGISAFARLREHVPECEYWIIGQGPERRNLEKLALQLGCADQTRFLGARSRQEVFRLLQEVDVLVHPSLREQFGYAVLEAMAAGRPVVCLDSGGPGILVDPACGFVISAEDPEHVSRHLVLALWRLAADPLLREQTSRACRLKVCRSYTWELQWQMLSALYQQIVSSHSCEAPTAPRY